MTTKFSHSSVLLHAAVNGLVDEQFNPKAKHVHDALAPQHLSGVFVDGTFGRGGHSRYLLSHLSPEARLFVFDKDPQAIAVAQELAAQDSRVTVVHEGFAQMPQVLADNGIGHVRGIMLDLGVSSPQIDDATRGFSFMRDGPLDMRMDTSRGMTAAEWLAQASIDDMKGVIKDYGEERYAFQIAKAIANRRQSQPLRTTLELAELVANTVRQREKGQHPATRTFQAIRIYLNQELSQLASTLSSVLGLLQAGGRLSVISFHSLEDRMVKQAIAAASKLDAELARLPLRQDQLPPPQLLNLGKLKASAQEVSDNPRARSATLRVAQRTTAEVSQ
ncbi:16S rRNA (cytosine(1402)-N(4))-methyltransferase RsmH [Brackiella oedipodis]|uniref:16S rRNA (cytosine(1402)-N(4))-methyltransferase RsmH n=1 Tax=Brackiella oedipodis TaxID=124225 RepID=UPI000491F006|nr:16S rRNA (cytosine(1402)-N(4))-methyltransferase RsmH [Brackiella oedipodis]